ncbi:putative ArCR [uncultured archaeon]|nr:putative ArCR [uncultured archaeon]
MDIELKQKFIELWKKYFNNAELPITFYYTDEEGHAELVKPGSVSRCVIGAVSNIRKGKSFAFNIESVGCFGGKRYLGFSENIRPNFEFFLSCGIPGELEGERYKKTPELVIELMEKIPKFKAPAQYIVFKRWDMLEESDNPEVVIFFARPDVLSGLFTLAGFDMAEPNGVFSPFGAGCATIVQYPYIEKDSDNPRGVLGMFDVSARPFVPEDMLTFSVPMNKFVTMIENMEESFLITGSWKMVQKRIGKNSYNS